MLRKEFWFLQIEWEIMNYNWQEHQKFISLRACLYFNSSVIAYVQRAFYCAMRVHAQPGFCSMSFSKPLVRMLVILLKSANLGICSQSVQNETLSCLKYGFKRKGVIDANFIFRSESKRACC